MTDDNSSERKPVRVIDWNELVALSRRYDLGPTTDTEKTRRQRDARALRRLLTARRRVGPRPRSPGNAGGGDWRALIALAALDFDLH